MIVIVGFAAGDSATMKFAYMPSSACPGNPQIIKYFPAFVAVNCTVAVCHLVIPVCGFLICAPGNAGALSAVAGSGFVGGMT